MPSGDSVIPIAFIVIAFLAGAALMALVVRWRLNTGQNQQAELRAALRIARNENHVMEMIALNASDGLILQDIHGRILWSNPAYSRITGWPAEEIRGRNPLSFIIPPERHCSDEEIAAFKYDVTSGILDHYEIVANVRKNGERFWNQLSFAVVEGEAGTEPQVIIIARDVTEQIEREADLNRAKQNLQKLAETDVLTGLHNRLKLDSFLDEALERAGQKHGEVGLIHVDIDQFKDINDSRGHAAGDAVLSHTADVLRSEISEDDLACRFGGDEFVIICLNIRSSKQLEALARRILVKLREPLIWENAPISIGASIGVAISGEHSRNAEKLMRQADIALYEIKNSGRNGLLLFSDSLGDLVAKRTEISSALSHGMVNNQLGVVLQPQFDLIKQQVTGFEALMRWHHPKRGILAPADFFDIAERNGLMEGIDEIAVRGALDALCTLREAGHESLRISINISGRRLNQDDFLDQLKWEVEKRGLEPKDVAVEVLETTLIEGPDNQAARSIAALSEAGFGVELDDFGSGYSGLVNLAQLKVKGVKIDRALVQNLVTDKTSQTVVQAILRLCKDLGLDIVAEGVELPEQAGAIVTLGGRVVQGYGIARPMSLDKALNWLETTDMTSVLAFASDNLRLQRHA